MNKIELDIVALSHSVTSSHNYAVVLRELEGIRRLPIVIGGFEAQAIAVAMENMSPNRPLTHDLFKNTLDVFDIQLQEVVINELDEGIFYALLICSNNGRIIEIDARTSDAIAMAVRYECPIFTYESILEEAGVTLDEEGTEDTGKSRRRSPSRSDDAGSTSISSIEDLETVELEKLLEKVLANEDYEKAAKIRDEINRREGNDPSDD